MTVADVSVYLLLALSPFMSVAPLIACLRANHRWQGRRVPRLLGPDPEPAKDTGATLIQMGRRDGDDHPPPLDAAEEAEEETVTEDEIETATLRPARVQMHLSREHIKVATGENVDQEC